MTLLTNAVMILAMAHAVTPALLPHSPSIAIPTSFGTASQVNTRNFGGYDYPTPRPPQNIYHTPGYEYSTPKTYSYTIPQVVTTPKNKYLPPPTPRRKTVPPQVQYYTSTPHTPLFVAAPTPPQVRNMYIPPVVSTPPSFQIVNNPIPPQIRNVYVPSHVRSKRRHIQGFNSKPSEPRNALPFLGVARPVSGRHSEPNVYNVHTASFYHPTPFRSVATPSPPNVTNFNVGPYQYTTPKTPFQHATTPKVNVPHLTPRPPSRSLNTYLPPVHSTSRTTISPLHPPSYTTNPPFHPPQVPFNPPQVPLQPPQPLSPPRRVPAPEGHQHEHGTPYQFRYLVQDENEGVDFNEDAVSDGDTIRGEYRVLLPDGRRQIVRYVADWINGYNALVEYEGTAVYPDQLGSDF